MIYDQVLHHHVQRCLERDLGVPRCDADDDGDYGAIMDGRVVWVRPMFDESPALVRVWAAALHGVKKSAALLTEINEINVGLTRIRCVLLGRNVTITAEAELESIEPGELGRLVTLVGQTAEHVGELIHAVFGGDMPLRVGVVRDDDEDEDIDSWSEGGTP